MSCLRQVLEDHRIPQSRLVMAAGRYGSALNGGRVSLIVNGKSHPTPREQAALMIALAELGVATSAIVGMAELKKLVYPRRNRA